MNISSAPKLIYKALSAYNNNNNNNNNNNKITEATTYQAIM